MGTSPFAQSLSFITSKLIEETKGKEKKRRSHNRPRGKARRERGRGSILIYIDKVIRLEVFGKVKIFVV